ncbi:phytoene desaturase family protein [Alkalibacillus almallahensis]|uniref:phytoene desaturase family protein n=1 Tax=Alkalibacillus almallahensis TaxID=1379154 RepID=UPI001421734E|nr:phytoene desaturase family protein [Alkalibacillus almallahensis]NIK11396.1 phytoene desaturase [Alkalibacillus almallahensis]
MKQIVIMGAGLGGLSSAIVLANEGYDVQVLEKNQEPGGKLQQRNINGYHFDLGPSTITLKHMFEEVFTLCGRDLADYVEFYPIKDGTLNMFHDGTQVPFSSDIKGIQEAIAQFSVHDAQNYPAFLSDSQQFYEIAENQFLNRLMDRWQDKLDITLLRQFMKIKPFTTYHDWLKKYFNHPFTLSLLGRYATYVGSSPYQAPAIYGMMAYIEAGLGIYGIKGGTYQIVEAMQQLAEELGVRFSYNTEVTHIMTENNRAIGVEIGDEHVYADQVIANMDALTVYDRFFPNQTEHVKKTEPSLSGFALLLGLNHRYEWMQHHQVFFPESYEQEFEHLFQAQDVISDPTIYICYSGYNDLSVVPSANHSNLFVLVNAPSRIHDYDWETLRETYTTFLLDQLEANGLTNIRDYIEYLEVMTPQDLHEQTGAYQGAIYGASSNSFRQAFFRLPNQAKEINGLWFVGGSTHPGGGTPIVTRSGRLVAEAIINREA